MNTDEHFMQRCLHLAIQGLGNVAPNPMVGCVIVHEGIIIGEGFHQKSGEAHAEVNAIHSVADEKLLQHSTLYVNLEPCSHHGKTPPCTDLIVQKKIQRVVIGSFDPNPLVAGKGIQKLKEAGIEVVTDVLKEESAFLNRRFLTFHKKKRPCIILKWAQSADGFMAPDEPKQLWLTNNESRKLVHKWRSEEQAILVGRKTVEIDNPELTVRLWKGKNPTRIIIDKNLELNPASKVFDDAAQTLVFNESESSDKGNVERIKIDFSVDVEKQLSDALLQRNFLSVIIEGGAITLNSFIQKNLWDEARIFTTKHILKGGKSAPRITESLPEELEIENDHLKIVQNPNS